VCEQLSTSLESEKPSYSENDLEDFIKAFELEDLRELILECAQLGFSFEFVSDSWRISRVSTNNKLFTIGLEDLEHSQIKLVLAHEIAHVIRLRNYPNESVLECEVRAWKKALKILSLENDLNAFEFVQSAINDYAFSQHLKFLELTHSLGFGITAQKSLRDFSEFEKSVNQIDLETARFKEFVRTHKPSTKTQQLSLLQILRELEHAQSTELENRAKALTHSYFEKWKKILRLRNVHLVISQTEDTEKFGIFSIPNCGYVYANPKFLAKALENCAECLELVVKHELEHVKAKRLRVKDNADSRLLSALGLDKKEEYIEGICAECRAKAILKNGLCEKCRTKNFWRE